MGRSMKDQWESDWGGAWQQEVFLLFWFFVFVPLNSLFFKILAA